MLSNTSVSYSGLYLVAQPGILPKMPSCTSYDQVYSAITNVLAKGYSQAENTRLLGMECLSNRIIWQE